MTDLIIRLASRVLIFPKSWVHQLVFWGGAIVVAITVILFAKASAWGNDLFASVVFAHPFFALVLTPAGFAGLVWLTRRYFVGGEGSGIPQTMAAADAPEMADRVSVLSLRVVFGKVILTTLGLCVGASVGREGPSVQVGAAIMHALGKRLHISDPRTQRALISAGGAAGIAAAFNTPLAGIIFAVEELSRSFEERTSGTALTTVIVAGVVSIALLGNYTYFGHTGVSLALEQAWMPVLLCGVVGGLLGGFFARFLITFSKPIPGRLGSFMASRPVAFAALCGLALAVIGQFCNHSIFGTGYEEARSLIEGTRELPVSFGPLKMLATAVSYISGLPGGIFAPSLAVGAGLGSDISSLVPDAPVAAVVILGMAGYFTGVVQAPVTAIIIVMEMTDNQSLTLPLMATAFIAFAISRLVCPSPLYRTLAQSFLDRAKRRSVREEQTTEGTTTATPPSV